MERDDRLAKEAVDALNAAWAGGEPSAVLECFAFDLVFFGSGEGEDATGRAGLETLLRSLRAQSGDSTFAIEWDDVTGQRAGDVLLVRALGRIRAAGSLRHLDGSPYRVTGVLVRSDDRWRWQVYHASEPSA